MKDFFFCLFKYLMQWFTDINCNWVVSYSLDPFKDTPLSHKIILNECPTEIWTYLTQRNVPQRKQISIQCGTSLYHRKSLLLRHQSKWHPINRGKAEFLGEQYTCSLFILLLSCVPQYFPAQFALLPQCEWQKL